MSKEIKSNWWFNRFVCNKNCTFFNICLDKKQADEIHDIRTTCSSYVRKEREQ